MGLKNKKIIKLIYEIRQTLFVSAFFKNQVYTEVNVVYKYEGDDSIWILV
ncbi:hypothetical protein [Acholeplasma palmae]|nr:hypothetical protein [Alteracholeplasma palmae]